MKVQYIFIDIDSYKKKIYSGEISTAFVNSSEQLADVFA